MSRRTWLAGVGFSLAVCPKSWGRTGFVEDQQAAAKAGLIVRSRRPLDLETPVADLDGWVTPNDRFFVRSHFGSPAITRAPWKIALEGLLDRPGSLKLDELDRFEGVRIPAVLQCSGNGRAFFKPLIPGVAWERGGVGQADWTGVRLADVLRDAGIQSGAAHVQFLGSDGPPSPKTPAWHRSLPIERALDPSTLLATHMNGEPLPVLHGGPVRLIVPGWGGNHWMKWVRNITVSRQEADSFYMQTAYKMPIRPAGPGAVVPPEELRPVTWLNVKSLITHPLQGSKHSPGSIEIRGVAWTGQGTVDRVEVASGSGDHWSPAELIDAPRAGAWRRWKATLDLRAPGEASLRARATDSTGATQPVITPWNKSGYLWNGI
ncbi:MAG: sulfite oxidase, partial [Isosphaeraceae bacterium]